MIRYIEKAGVQEALGHEELFYETQHTLFFLGETFFFFLLAVKFKF